VALLPVQPPEAVQEVLSLDDHVSVELPPAEIEAGVATSVTPGAALLTVMLTLLSSVPPVPEQLSVKVLLPDSAPVLSLPLVGLLPLQAPAATQLVASVDDHVSIVEPPASTVVSAALKVTVGVAAGPASPRVSPSELQAPSAMASPTTAAPARGRRRRRQRSGMATAQVPRGARRVSRTDNLRTSSATSASRLAKSNEPPPESELPGSPPPAALTVTVTDCEALSPLPSQRSVNVVFTVSDADVSVPDVNFVPLQPSDATQLVALVEDQVSAVVPLASTAVGFADSVTVGAGGGGGGGGVDPTVTIAVFCTLPPAPEQLSVKFVVVVNGPTDWLPEVAFEPLQPPDAVQEVALLLVQVSVLLPLA